MRRGFYQFGLVGALSLTAGATWCGDTVIARRFFERGIQTARGVRFCGFERKKPGAPVNRAAAGLPETPAGAEMNAP